MDRLATTLRSNFFSHTDLKLKMYPNASERCEYNTYISLQKRF